MIGLGANAAINLDGGGSSTFVFVLPPGASLTAPPAARALMANAGPPSGAGNNLWFRVLNRSLTRPILSVPPCVVSSTAPCGYRAIYANLGFTLVGGGATKPK